MLSRFRWRTVDLVTIAVLGSAFGVVYWAWNQIWAITTPLFIGFPPSHALFYGVWMLPIVIGAMIVRRPGAALLTSMAATIVSTLLGNAFGITMLLYGVAQGLAVELVFAATRYRKFGWFTAGLGSALASATGSTFDTILFYPFWDTHWKIAYVACAIVGGFIMGALLAPFVVRRLRRAAVLSDFAEEVESPTDPSADLAAAAGTEPANAAARVEPASLGLQPGERVLIAGRTGAGKTTLLRALAEQAEAKGPAQVAYMQQDPESNLLLSRVGDDVAFALESACVSRDEIWNRVPEVLDQVSLEYPLDRSTMELSGGEKQRLGLAGSVAATPKLVLLDEPTANLDEQGAKDAVAAVDRYVRSSGATLVVVDHNIELVQGLVDRIVVLEDSKIILDQEINSALNECAPELKAAGVFVPGAHRAVASDQFASEPTANNSEPVLSARSITVDRGTPPQRVLAGVDLDIYAGEIIAICGPNGAGKSTLARTLGGLLEPDSGEVRLADSAKPVHKLRAPELAQNIASVFQEPEHQFLTDSVSAELLVGLPKGAASEQLATQVLERFSLSHLANANPFAMSGGEKRRLALATAFMREPKVLILDEPTFGQDAQTWQEVTDEIAALAAGGVAVVAVTHDQEFVRATGARVVNLEKLVPASQEEVGV